MRILNFTQQVQAVTSDNCNANDIRFQNTSYWLFFFPNLELLLAVAAIRCGSMKGTECLISYLEDIHSNFRYFSRNELCSVYGKDGGYDRAAWRKLVKDKKSLKVSPLKKSIEV